jgi:hypothetical protein
MGPLDHLAPGGEWVPGELGLAHRLPDHGSGATVVGDEAEHAGGLVALLSEAARREWSFLDFLDRMLQEEVTAKQAKRFAMGLQIAHFPSVKSLDAFDFKCQPSLDARRVRELTPQALHRERGEGTGVRSAGRPTSCGGSSRRRSTRRAPRGVARRRPGEDGRGKLSCRDDGVGIPADVGDRVVRPFFTTRLGRGGSGLRRFIVHHLAVDTRRGTVSVTSSCGQGTAFEAAFPTACRDA